MDERMLLDMIWLSVAVRFETQNFDKPCTNELMSLEYGS